MLKYQVLAYLNEAAQGEDGGSADFWVVSSDEPCERLCAALLQGYCSHLQTQQTGFLAFGSH